MVWGKKAKKTATIKPSEDFDDEDDERNEEDELKNKEKELEEVKEELERLKASKIPEVKESKYSTRVATIIGGEMIGENSYRFIIHSTYPLGEIGAKLEE